MKYRLCATLVLAVVFLQPLLIPTAQGYSTILQPQGYGNTTITWTIIDAPEQAFGWWGPGFVFLGKWIAEDGTKMTYEITEVGGSNRYLTGNLVLGNLSISTNNTEIANNLILGLSGLVSWSPGVAIPVSGDSIQKENTTAYAAVERASGNWLNGTLQSRYENITVNGIEYECIVWDFIQDPVLYGKPQITTLAYDLATGVLVRGNSTYTFDVPYILVLELDFISIPQPVDVGTISLIIGGLGVGVILVLVLLKRKP